MNALTSSMHRALPIVAVLAVLAALACDGKDTTDAPVVLRTDSMAGPMIGVDPMIADPRTLRGVDYSLTPDRYRGWTRAQRDLDALPVAVSTERLRVRGTSDADVDRFVTRLQADPAARSAIERSGLTVRDYVLTTLALAQAMDATDGRPANRLAGVPAQNVEVYTRNRDDYRRLRQSSRFRVTDDGDSDDDADRTAKVKDDGGSDDKQRGKGKGRDNDGDSQN